MRPLPLRRTALATAIAVLSVATPIHAQLVEPVPEPPFSIADREENEQYSGAVAMSADGGSLLVWEERDGETVRLLARRLLPSGRQSPQVIEVAAHAPFATDARIALADDGSWAVAWTAMTEPGMTFDVYARRFDSNDQPVGDVFRVNDFEAGGQMMPALALGRAGGDLVVTWFGLGPEGDHAIFARRFPLQEMPRDTVRINLPGAAVNTGGGLVLEDDGSYVAAWSGERDAGDGSSEVLMRRIGADDHWDTGVRRISDASGLPESNPLLVRDAAGRFVVAWQVGNTALRLQRVWSDLVPDGVAVDVGRQGPNEELSSPALAIEAHGRVALAFHSGGAPDMEAGTYLERFTLDGGSHSDGRLRVFGIYDTPDFRPIAMAGDADGDVMLIWDGRQPGTEIDRAFYRRVAGYNAQDLALSMTAAETSVAYGAQFSYEMWVEHLGAPGGLPGEGTATGFRVYVPIPEGVTYDRVHTMDWTCTGPTPFAEPMLHCEYDRALPPGGTAYPIVVYAWAPSTWTRVSNKAQLSPWLHPDLDGSNNQALVDIYVGDTSPDAFSIPLLNGVARGSEALSMPVQVQGFNVPVTIGVWNGEYSIDGGPFTSEEGVVEAYALVRVRHTASSDWSKSTSSRLFVGDQRADFISVTPAQDTTPDAFAFTDRLDVALGASVTSNSIAVGGINDGAPVSVQGGSYSLNGAAFTTQPGTARIGDSLRVQHQAALMPGLRTDTVLTVGGVSDTFSSTTVPQDATPDAFAFAAQGNVPRGSERVSNEVTITGINGSVAISAAGGSYSLDGGAFTSAAGTIGNGQRVRLRHTAAAGFSASTTTTVSVGTGGATFTSTTETQDAVPNAFAFVDRSGLATAVEVISDPITVAGINVAAPVTVSGGSYSVNGGAFTTAAGSVVAGDQVRVRHVSSSSANAAVTTTLTIGGVSDGFTSTTGASDSTPNAFAFVDVTGAKRNKAVTSAPVTVAGINVAVPISVSGGGARWSKNGGAYTGAAGSVVNGDVVRLQVIAPNAANFSVNVQVSIGSVADTWTVSGN